MKVKCTNIYNEITKNYEKNNAWLKIGYEYVVLEVYVYSGKDILYRLNSDQNKTPVLFNASQFEVISGKIPSNWYIEQIQSGTIIFSPKLWQQPGFWERAFDGDPQTMEVYRREARIILDEENM